MSKKATVTKAFMRENTVFADAFNRIKQVPCFNCLYQEWCKPLLISCKAAFGYEQVAKWIVNIRLTFVLFALVSGSVVFAGHRGFFVLLEV